MPNFVKIGQSVAKVLRFFDFSRWRPSPSSIFEIVHFHLLTVSGGLSRITVPNIVKIGHFFAVILWLFEFSRWPPPLGFLKSWNFIGYWGPEVRDASARQILSNRSISCEDIKIFRFFKMAAAAILDFRNREFLFAVGIWEAQTHHCTKFRQNRSFYCADIAIFRIFKKAAAAILDFWNREILFVTGVQRVETDLHAKF